MTSVPWSIMYPVKREKRMMIQFGLMLVYSLETFIFFHHSSVIRCKWWVAGGWADVQRERVSISLAKYLEHIGWLDKMNDSRAHTRTDEPHEESKSFNLHRFTASSSRTSTHSNLETQLSWQVDNVEQMLKGRFVAFYLYWDGKKKGTSAHLPTHFTGFISAWVFSPSEIWIQ